ncbi:MAG: hypothetical protein RKE49_08815 [Oceanicaulis sp.]
MMPFGTREGIDFDKVLKDLIEPALEKSESEVEFSREDHEKERGPIHDSMIRKIIEANVAIADISTANPNVFYELGVRHAVRGRTTIIIKEMNDAKTDLEEAVRASGDASEAEDAAAATRAASAQLPFDIAGLRIFFYDQRRLDDYVGQLADIINDAKNSPVIDSLVWRAAPSLRVHYDTDPIAETTQAIAAIPRRVVKVRQDDPSGKTKPRSKEVQPDVKIGYMTGDLKNIRGVHAWVNPENTRMEMGRIHDATVSSTIRFFGAKRDRRERVLHDTIYLHLARIARRSAWFARKSLGGFVEPGTVIVTPPGQLRKSHKVRTLLHVAAFYGEPGNGYQPVRDVPNCIANCLAEIDRHNGPRGVCGFLTRTARRLVSPISRALGRRNAASTYLPIRTVVIPMVSVGSSADPETVRGALSYFYRAGHTGIKTVYFLAYTERDQELCEVALRHNGICIPDYPEPVGDARSAQPGGRER